MSSDSHFKGWVADGPEAADGKMVWKELKPKTWDEGDIDIKITHCGICGSDLHTLRSGWANVMAPTAYPATVGHEIVGTAVRVGSKATGGIKVGDRVGVGAQSSSCLKPDCDMCSEGIENHCPHMVATYNAPYPDGVVSKGGYADYSRHPSHFVFKIPDAIPSDEAAPMLCGGVTVYSPLKNNGCGPGKVVGIVGMGGLGHFGVLFAKALGADKVVAISRSHAKREDAHKLGADLYIATDDDKDWATHHAGSIDLIVCTISSSKMPLNGYLQLLRTYGSFIQVGAPEDSLPAFNAFALIGKGCKLGGSLIGSAAEIREMLDLCASKQIKPWIQRRPMKDANPTIVDMEAGKARYRYVLVNQSNGGEL